MKKKLLIMALIITTAASAFSIGGCGAEQTAEQPVIMPPAATESSQPYTEPEESSEPAPEAQPSDSIYDVSASDAKAIVEIYMTAYMNRDWNTMIGCFSPQSLGYWSECQGYTLEQGREAMLKQYPIATSGFTIESYEITAMEKLSEDEIWEKFDGERPVEAYLAEISLTTNADGDIQSDRLCVYADNYGDNVWRIKF